jgi:protein-S-isoprenylcysteine O-methyltransferase Ste14
MRWPLVYVLVCCFGVAVGIGVLCSFGEPESDLVKRTFLRVLGVLMVLVYGWLLIAFFRKIRRGVWSAHCQNRVLFFSGEPRI